MILGFRFNIMGRFREPHACSQLVAMQAGMIMSKNRDIFFVAEKAFHFFGTSGPVQMI